MDKHTAARIVVILFLLCLVACQPAATVPAETAQARTLSAHTPGIPSQPAGTRTLPPTKAVQPSSVTPPTPARHETSQPPAPTASEATVQPAPVNSPTQPAASPAEPTQGQAVETSPCNLAAPGNPIDITIPDGTELRPEEAFSKTWRLMNAGSCTWTMEYAVAWFSGEAFGVPGRLPLSNPVPAGETVDITIDLRAPARAGAYQGNWKLVDAEGACFGIGPNGDAPFWVRIQVVDDATPTPIPSITPTPTPAVAAGGLIVLVPNDELDLDVRAADTPLAADIQYLVRGDGSHLLLPINGTQFGTIFSTAPNLPDCQAVSLTDDPLIIDEVAPGSYFCYETSQDQPGWGRLVLLDPTSGTLAFEHLTWLE